MEGYLWLLLQTLPLLTAVAFVFFILGWRWRGQNSQDQLQKQDQKLDSQDIQTEGARQELHASREIEEKLREKLADSQNEIKETQAREVQLQKEILRLSDELKRSKVTPVSVPSDVETSPPASKTVATKKAPTKAAKKAAKAKKKPTK